LEKEDYSAFVETDIEEILEKNKINYVYVVGVYTYLCVKANVIDLAKKHRVFVIEDCISSDDLDKSNKAKEYMKTMSEFIKAEKFLST
ncbi:MAG: isochorismatase family protein, partial [Nanoarchaeota archaeon]|nr:isochorismatase family protein [Nanoarchaeota archaeon]